MVVKLALKRKNENIQIWSRYSLFKNTDCSLPASSSAALSTVNRAYEFLGITHVTPFRRYSTLRAQYLLIVGPYLQPGPTASWTPVSPFPLFVVTEPSGMLSVPTEGSHMGYRENVSLDRYVEWRVAHAPVMPGTFSPPPTSNETASKRSRHASRHMLHARALMHVGIAN